jgi:hypothetical protein
MKEASPCLRCGHSYAKHDGWRRFCCDVKGCRCDHYVDNIGTLKYYPHIVERTTE